MMAATPASSKRRASSSAVSSEVSAHPCVATLPSRASSPTATRLGHLLAASFTRAAPRPAVARCGGADDHAVDALVEPALDRRHVADAAAELHAQADGLEDALDRGGIARLARAGAGG